MPAEVTEQIVDRYAPGEPAKVVALALGVPASQVYRVLKEKGVLRSRSEARKVVHAQRRAVGRSSRISSQRDRGSSGSIS